MTRKTSKVASLIQYNNKGIKCARCASDKVVEEVIEDNYGKMLVHKCLNCGFQIPVRPIYDFHKGNK